jgi:ethanolamine utilization protein EutA (predicted chaperonin)
MANPLGYKTVSHQVPLNQDHTDFNNWTLGTIVGAGAATISADGSEVTFTRNVPDRDWETVL